MEVDFWDFCSLIFATKCLNLFFESQSLSLSLWGSTVKKCWAWTIGWGSNLWSSLLDKTLWNWAKNKNAVGNKSHGPNISQDAIVAVMKVNTKNVCGRPGGGRDTTTSHWPLNVHFCTPRPVFFSIFGVFGLRNHTYTIRKKKNNNTFSNIYRPQTKKTQNQRTYLPTKTQTRFRQNPFFFIVSVSTLNRTVWFASMSSAWFFRFSKTLLSSSTTIDTSKVGNLEPWGRQAEHATSRGKLATDGWLVGWLVGLDCFFGLQKIL